MFLDNTAANFAKARIEAYDVQLDQHLETADHGAFDFFALATWQTMAGDQEANVANWSTHDEKRGGIGGAMDLVAGTKNLIIVMEHCDSKGRAKLKRKCTYPLTGAGCVNYVVTDLAVLHWVDNRFVLEKVAPGFTPQEVIALAEMEIFVAPNVGVMA